MDVLRIRSLSVITLAGSIFCFGILFWTNRQAVLYSDQLHKLESSSTTVQFSVHVKIPMDGIIEPTFRLMQTREYVILIYPRAMRIDETPKVLLEYILLPDDGSLSARIRPIPSNAEKVQKITLTGANFEVKPEETRKLPADQKRLLWTVKAKSTGSHNLIVNMASLFRFLNPWLKVTDGEDERFIDPSAGDFAIPISVYTVWNISERTATIIQWIVALTAFLLALPFLSDLFHGLLPLLRVKGP